jgi:hypothetical protein
MTLLASLAWTQDQGRDFHWSGKLAPEQLVEIRNINGSINAEGADTDEVQVTAEKRGPHADQVRIEVVPNSEGVLICAIYPGSSDSCERGGHWKGNNERNNTQVHFMVRMPRNLRFAGESVNGNVAAENMGRFVNAESVNGSIRVSTAAWAKASSVNGSIKARMGNADWTGTLKLSTVDMNAELSFSSVNGRVDSDFPVTIKGGFVGHSAHGTIGSGGRQLVIDTVNGNLELRKLSGSV